MSVFKADGFAGEVIGASAELIYSVPCGGGSVIRAVSVIFCLVELYRESVVAVVSNSDFRRTVTVVSFVIALSQSAEFVRGIHRLTVFG